MRAPLSLFLTSLLLSGCANKMSGTFGGRDVGPARDAIFDEMSYGDIRFLSVEITGASEACEVKKEIAEVDYDTCADFCSDMVDLVKDYLKGDQLWVLSLSMLQDDEVVNSYKQDTSGAPDSFGAEIAAYDLSLYGEKDSCIQACDETAIGLVPLEQGSADGGMVEITEYEPENLLKGDFEIAFENETVEGHFEASFCDMGLGD